MTQTTKLVCDACGAPLPSKSKIWSMDELELFGKPLKEYAKYEDGQFLGYIIPELNPTFLMSKMDVSTNSTLVRLIRFGVTATQVDAVKCDYCGVVNKLS